MVQEVAKYRGVVGRWKEGGKRLCYMQQPTVFVAPCPSAVQSPFPSGPGTTPAHQSGAWNADCCRILVFQYCHTQHDVPNKTKRDRECEGEREGGREGGKHSNYASSC